MAGQLTHIAFRKCHHVKKKKLLLTMHGFSSEFQKHKVGQGRSW